jgi:hypothetical protein
VPTMAQLRQEAWQAAAAVPMQAQPAPHA